MSTRRPSVADALRNIGERSHGQRMAILNKAANSATRKYQDGIAQVERQLESSVAAIRRYVVRKLRPLHCRAEFEGRGWAIKWNSVVAETEFSFIAHIALCEGMSFSVNLRAKNMAELDRHIEAVVAALKAVREQIPERTTLYIVGKDEV